MSLQGIILEGICSSITGLKNKYMRNFSPTSYVTEVIPCEHSTNLDVEQKVLDKLNLFAQNNPIYKKEIEIIVDGTKCKSYQGDINNYWLSSKKYDTCYQPFYPTWILSAYALAFLSKQLGYTELVDVGSGDGRIAYCSTLVGLKPFSLEIDTELSLLQQNVVSSTGVDFKILNVDATGFDYNSLDLSCPVFFISGLPELGDMLARDVITKTRNLPNAKGALGFNFMGTHVMRRFTADKTLWGWGNIIKDFELNIIGCVTLPTLWTNDQDLDTAYIFAQKARM
jgi:hypothetical protein